MIVIVRTNHDENLIFTAVRTWVQDVPEKVYIYDTNPINYGFKYAMLERAPNLVFTNQIECNDDYLVLLRPGQYLEYSKLPATHSQIFTKETIQKLNINNLLKSNLRGECSDVIKSLSTPNAMLNYHAYKQDWDVYTFLSKINNVAIPNFPVFASSIRVDDFADLPTLIATLITQPPMKRVLILPRPTPIDNLLDKVGYDIQYGEVNADVLISNKYVEGYKAVLVRGRCSDKIPTGYHHSFNAGWTTILSSSYHQRRVDIVSYFNEVDMLKFRIKELYDHFDHIIVGKMDTPHSSNIKVTDGYPTIEDPLNKVELLMLTYPDEIKELNDDWIRERYFRQYSIYHPLIGDYDLLFILDLDEIPNVKTIETECLIYLNTAKRLEMEMHYYNFKWVKPAKWYHGYFGHVSEVRKYGADTIRVNQPVQYPIVKKGGWHISYFLTPEMISYKIKSFVHQEWNKPPYIEIDHIKRCIDQGLDLYLRPYDNMVPADPKYLPNNYRMLPEFTWP